VSPRRWSADCSSGVGWKQTADLGQMVGYSSSVSIACAQPLWGPYKKGVTRPQRNADPGSRWSKENLSSRRNGIDNNSAQQ